MNLFFFISIILNFLAGATASIAATTTAITAVVVAMQVTAKNVKPTQSVLTTNYEQETFTFKGFVSLKYNEDLIHYLWSGKGCLYVHIYDNFGRRLSSKKFSINGRLRYTIDFKGFYGEAYSVR